MSLRTYPLIAHPAFLRFVESADRQLKLFAELEPAEVPVHYPRLDRPYDLARYLGINPLMVRSCATKKEKHYRSFDVRKRSGGTRTIDAPRTFLKVIQWWILDTILENRSDLPCIYGFSKGRSFIDNAKVHHGANYILNVDVKDFFPSVRSGRVYPVFSRLGYNHSVASILTELCTYNDALPQGAPTSPKLSNFVFEECDIKLQNLQLRYNVKYTRYADDLTFSSSDRINSDILGEIAAIIRPCGFTLNPSKTRFMGPNRVKEVTGLVLGRDGVALPRAYLNATRGWFHSIREAPDFYQGKLENVLGTLRLLEQVGGRGTDELIRSGQQALLALRATAPPKLEWGTD